MTRQPLDLVLKFSQGSGVLAVDTDHPAVAAFRRGMEEGQLTGTWRFLLIPDYTPLFNLTGRPAMVLPCGFSLKGSLD